MVCVGREGIPDDFPRRVPQRYPCAYELKLEDRLSHFVKLSVHGETPRDAAQCLSFLYCLPDSKYKCFYFPLLAHAGEHKKCPLNAVELQHGNPGRRTHFRCMHFNEDQSEAIAKTHASSSIILDDCLFDHEGGAFVQGLDERHRKHDRFGLDIRVQIPFDIFQWYSLLRINATHLDLSFSNMYISAEMSREIFKRKFLSLKLEDCRFEDHGATLVKSIRRSKGPKTLILKAAKGVSRTLPLESQGGRLVFMKEIGQNERLERLEIVRIPMEKDAMRSLVKSLKENSTLTRLELVGSRSNGSSYLPFKTLIEKAVADGVFVSIRKATDRD